MHFPGFYLPPGVLRLHLFTFSILHPLKFRILPPSCTYSHTTGGLPWPLVSPACADHFQSPVDIRPELTAFRPALRPLEFFGFQLPLLTNLRLSNNGHTGEAVSGRSIREGAEALWRPERALGSETVPAMLRN